VTEPLQWFGHYTLMWISYGPDGNGNAPDPLHAPLLDRDGTSDETPALDMCKQELRDIRQTRK